MSSCDFLQEELPEFLEQEVLTSQLSQRQSWLPQQRSDCGSGTGDLWGISIHLRVAVTIGLLIKMPHVWALYPLWSKGS